jgi:hypothetical protein
LFFIKVNVLNIPALPTKGSAAIRVEAKTRMKIIDNKILMPLLIFSTVENDSLMPMPDYMRK